MRLTLLTAVFWLASRGAAADYLQPRQAFLSTLLSALNPDIGDDGPTTTDKPTSKPSKTQSSRSTTTKSTQTKSQSKTTSPTPTSTTVSSSTSTSTDTSTITSSATLATSTTSTPTSTPTSVAVDPQPSPPAARSGGVPPAGIAVAVIFSIIFVLIIAWLLFRYHPKCRAMWAARQERKYKERSYRDALDGPNAGGLVRGRAGLQSFFQPKSPRARGGVMGTIKRKTIHWGAPSAKLGSGRDAETGTVAPNQRGFGSYDEGDGFNHGMQRSYSKNSASTHGDYQSGEKFPLAELASPMGVENRPPQHHPAAAAMFRSPNMSPISPVSAASGKSPGPVLSTSNSVRSARSGPTQPPSAALRPSNAANGDKSLPEVKVNGQVIYELA